jgi:hypothetical protein
MQAGERTARLRVDAVYAAVDRITPDDLRLTPLAARDPATRGRLIAELEATAARHGRGPLLAEARDWLREALSGRVLARYHLETGIWATNTSGRVEDQVAVFLALDDVVAVAVAEDLVDTDAAAWLAGPGRQLLGLAPLGAPGIPAASVTPAAPVSPGKPDGPRTAPPAWEPSAEDWAAANAGPAAVDPEERMAGPHRLRVAAFAAVAVVGVPAAVGWGLSNDGPLLGVLGAAAVIALCWTFATYRPARNP